MYAIRSYYVAKTNPEAPRHQQYSTFIVELPSPGYNIIRDIPTMAVHGPHYTEMGGGHAERNNFV